MAFGILLLAAWLMLPSGQAQQQQSQQPFTIKVDTQLVVETVIVKDKDGKPIEGLTEKDFVVTEDNVPQTISVFQFQRLDETPVASTAAAPAPTVPAAQPASPTNLGQISAPPP